MGITVKKVQPNPSELSWIGLHDAHGEISPRDLYLFRKLMRWRETIQKHMRNGIAIYEALQGAIDADTLEGLASSAFALASHTHVEAEITDLAHTTDAADLVSGVLANGRVQESNVTQHEAAIDHDALSNFDPYEHHAFSVDVTQASHGFSVGSPVYIDNTSTWNLAKADAIGTLAMGVVTFVSGDDFTVQFGGILAGLGSLSAGTIYYLSAATAGALVTTPPATATQFVQLVIHTTATVRVLRLGQGMEVP